MASSLFTLLMGCVLISCHDFYTIGTADRHIHILSVAGLHYKLFSREKMKISDSVLWQKPFYPKKNKYNNAKRSIPAHPTFVNDTHRDLHLWTVTSKINRFTLVNMSAKFEEEAHISLVCIRFKACKSDEEIHNV